MRDPRNAATPPSVVRTTVPPAPVTPAHNAVLRWAALAAEQQCCPGVPHQTVRSA